MGLECLHAILAGSIIPAMPGLELILIVVLGALAWLWLDSLRARESAIRAARAACAADGLMLLDDTVAISAVKRVRDENGRLKLQRAYEFEYSDTGNNRLKGSVVLIGHRVVILNVGVRNAPAVMTLH